MRKTMKMLIGTICVSVAALICFGEEFAAVILCLLLVGSNRLVNFIPETNNEKRQVKEKLSQGNIEPEEAITPDYAVPETIEKRNEVHIIEDEDLGCSYAVDQAFKPAKSHAGEVNLLCTYAPDEDYGHEGDFPCIAVVEDNDVYCAVEEYQATKTLEGAMFMEPLDGKFLFRAKKKSYGSMMYFYGLDLDEHEYWTNAGLCRYYPMEYMGTANEEILMQILDEAAQSFHLANNSEK